MALEAIRASNNVMASDLVTDWSPSLLQSVSPTSDVLKLGHYDRMMPISVPLRGRVMVKAAMQLLWSCCCLGQKGYFRPYLRQVSNHPPGSSREPAEPYAGLKIVFFKATSCFNCENFRQTQVASTGIRRASGGKGSTCFKPPPPKKNNNQGVQYAQVSLFMGVPGMESQKLMRAHLYFKIKK